MSQQTYTINDLLTLMARLREPDFGCPWDLDQSYRTIAASTLEEAYEVVDAIEQDNVEQLKEELGDLLFQVVFYSQLGKEDQRFSFDDITSSITAKLLRRHPHVFPDGTLDSRIDLDCLDVDRRQASIKATWEATKREEREQKGYHGIMDDVPTALPATIRSTKLQKRAASVGFDWDSTDGVYEKIAEEIAELKEATESASSVAIEEELGDLLFSVINLSRHLKVEPETALRKANSKFEQRFNKMESIAEAKSTSLDAQSMQTLNEWWQQAKES
ncbi:MAG: nucleoside triphosphate pyrophosphohydrolase [Cellvibrionaceae bacterium]